MRKYPDFDWEPSSNIGRAPFVGAHYASPIAGYVAPVQDPDPDADPSKPDIKESNPKDAIGSRKVPLGLVPQQVVAEVGLALLEGACKYGAHNYRAIGVRSSVYHDAAHRHLAAWWEGQDIDPASGLHHITKALASLTVLRDAMIQGMCEDDRPPAAADPDWVERLNAEAARIIDAHPEPKAPFTERGGHTWRK